VSPALRAAAVHERRAERLRRELGRKAIHVASVAVPLFVWVAPRGVALAALAAVVLAALAVEWMRRRVRWARYHFLRRTRTLLRAHERDEPAGATWMAAAYLVAAAALPRPLAVTAMLYNGLGDAAAALVGRRWGRHRIRGGKSWEGFAAALGVNLAVGLLVPGIAPAAALAGAAAAAALEFAPLPLDDNLRTTLGGGAALWIATLLAA
jgi:dolichol kinase